MITTTPTLFSNFNKKYYYYFLVLCIIFIIIIVIRIYNKLNKNETNINTCSSINKNKQLDLNKVSPCPDYWTDIIDNKKTPGICHNTHKLGNCRKDQSIFYLDTVYLINVKNEYIRKQDSSYDVSDIKSDDSYNINDQISYNTNFTYLTLTDNISTCNSLSNDFSCYEMKSVSDTITPTTKDPNITLYDISGHLEDAKLICNNREQCAINYSNRYSGITGDSKNHWTTQGKTEQRGWCGKAGESKFSPDISTGYYEQSIHADPDYDKELPINKECQGIMKHNNKYKLIYGKTDLNALPLEDSNNKVWIKSFCTSSDNTNKEIMNTFIPINKSRWVLEKKSNTNDTNPLQSNDTFYIKCINNGEELYLTICENNNIQEHSKLLAAAPLGCNKNFSSVHASKDKNINSEWTCTSFANSNTLIQSNEYIYLSPVKQPTLYLSTCGNKLNNTYLQLTSFDNNKYNNIWKIIVHTSDVHNPVIDSFNFNTELQTNDQGISNNMFNLKKKCKWAKKCNVTWDIVDTLCD